MGVPLVGAYSAQGSVFTPRRCAELWCSGAALLVVQLPGTQEVHPGAAGRAVPAEREGCGGSGGGSKQVQGRAHAGRASGRAGAQAQGFRMIDAVVVARRSTQFCTRAPSGAREPLRFWLFLSGAPCKQREREREEEGRSARAVALPGGGRRSSPTAPHQQHMAVDDVQAVHELPPGLTPQEVAEQVKSRTRSPLRAGRRRAEGQRAREQRADSDRGTLCRIGRWSIVAGARGAPLRVRHP